MVNSTVEREQRTPAPEYPMLMESAETPGLIVFMVCPKCGTVISTESVYAVGTYSNTWAMACFTPFHGRVILEGV